MFHSCFLFHVSEWKHAQPHAQAKNAVIESSANTAISNKQQQAFPIPTIYMAREAISDILWTFCNLRTTSLSVVSAV